jgi:hypothetical protein
METDGNLAAVWGLFTRTYQLVEGGNPIQMQGRFTGVARNIDDSWLYVADLASLPLPPPTEELKEGLLARIKGQANE